MVSSCLGHQRGKGLGLFFCFLSIPGDVRGPPGYSGVPPQDLLSTPPWLGARPCWQQRRKVPTGFCRYLFLKLMAELILHSE